jgi:hypothetical protein
MTLCKATFFLQSSAVNNSTVCCQEFLPEMKSYMSETMGNPVLQFQVRY